MENYSMYVITTLPVRLILSSVDRLSKQFGSLSGKTKCLV